MVTMGNMGSVGLRRDGVRQHDGRRAIHFGERVNSEPSRGTIQGLSIRMELIDTT